MTTDQLIDVDLANSLTDRYEAGDLELLPLAQQEWAKHFSWCNTSECASLDNGRTHRHTRTFRDCQGNVLCQICWVSGGPVIVDIPPFEELTAEDLGEVITALQEAQAALQAQS